MNRIHALLACAALAVAPTIAGAQMATPTAMPTAAPTQAPMTAAEQTFYATASSMLPKMYPNVAAAQKAGYFRFNNEDRSGAISYENPNDFDSPDAGHPQQLWFDVNGRLLGGDWSQTVASAPNGPTLFGLSTVRFHKIPLHIHYGAKRADGTIDYGLFVRATDFTAAGLDPLHPTAADLVKLGKVTSPDQVAFVFALLNNYDAQMWVIPNASGQFADTNPAVAPSANQGKAAPERQT
jgi:hypothetical protein